MKFLAFVAVLLVGANSAYAGGCDIFAAPTSFIVQSAPQVVVQSAPVTYGAPLAYGAAVAVPANVQVQNYANVQYVPQPVVLQSAVAPLVQPYAITSVQPVIGVQSFAPTGAQVLSVGGYSVGNAIVQQRSVQILSNGHNNNGVQILNLNNNRHNNNGVQVLNLNNNRNNRNVRVLNLNNLNRRNNNNDIIVLNNNRHNNNNNIVLQNANNVRARRGLFGGTVVRAR